MIPRFDRKLGTIDDRGCHFHVALAAQDKDAALKKLFTPIAAELTANEGKIIEELLAVQGKPVDIGGYYRPDFAKADSED